ncbi:serine/threonine-protein phosphatase 2A 56 kDa regulatory subunit delta isoform-like [Syngnathus typhle]|uniref:serine/threonine-protein phosphatase 2A 56 kDa regulatory subunit delta isoform-like n=1 Tax=Syngnathus typhle TaxID=161592 RepID=UPI002A69AE6B|nr:serine/threonine-protein phosphatase 2A 56 kDa regulatory subunit delta isoform-like [Syngnathus typhle]XP_061157018.1 serine/threonine-protein phosphatase 2A 56 kDa regulatory subunit delta isoform-like [Syngnathus typhle]
MPQKSKKDKDSTKSGKAKKSASENGPASDDASNKKVPPTTQLMRIKQPGSHTAVRREKRFSSSCFALSTNRELHKLDALAGMPVTLLGTLVQSHRIQYKVFLRSSSMHGFSPHGT